MTEVHEAARLISENVPRQRVSNIALHEAFEHILAENIVAERDIPAFDRVTMDGIAVSYAEFAAGRREFSIAGIQPAGCVPLSISDPSNCVRVMTGAVCPAGTDTVIPIERVSLSGNCAAIDAKAEVTAQQFVHHRGTDRKLNSVVLSAGTRIGPPEMAVLASVGAAHPSVFVPPRVSIISTGDELVGVDEAIAPHQIRSSNGRAIEAAIQRHHCGSTKRLRLRDEPDALLETLDKHHAESDVIVLSGGVSMGDFDFVPGALEHLGARVVFHRIRQKPGRPMWFGLSKNNKPIFALPGNPVSTLVCMTRFVIPALKIMMGVSDSRRELVTLENVPPGGPRSFTWFVPVLLSWNEQHCLAQPKAINTSGDFTSLANTDGIVELSADETQRRAGSAVPLYRW